jgi:hypothetical protein
MAGRQAQAIAETVSAVEHAEQALAERARAFAQASKALRAELSSFAAILAEGEQRLVPPQSSDEPDLRLVESPPKPATHEAPAGFGQVLIADAETAEESAADESDDDHRPEGEFESDDDEEDDSDGDDDEDPPTPAEIAQFFREHEEAELARQARTEREEQGRPGLGERLRNFFSAPPESEAEPEKVIEAPASAQRAPKPKRERIPKRDRLYTDLGGAAIGLGGAAALINFVRSASGSR